jgi:hypothetical protein
MSVGGKDDAARAVVRAPFQSFPSPVALHSARMSTRVKTSAENVDFVVIQTHPPWFLIGRWRNGR